MKISGAFTGEELFYQFIFFSNKDAPSREAHQSKYFL